eukprot:GHVQ01004804.1.p2 GENE.GHVQ01004804.1~~GHVQ01004804.1.p2  ORF type:complete len:141 (-),score=13.15 GHVQ01004804.1:355-777(-)
MTVAHIWGSSTKDSATASGSSMVVGGRMFTDGSIARSCQWRTVPALQLKTAKIEGTCRQVGNCTLACCELFVFLELLRSRVKSHMKSSRSTASLGDCGRQNEHCAPKERKIQKGYEIALVADAAVQHWSEAFRLLRGMRP